MGNHMSVAKVGVIGGGAWGTALAQSAACAGYRALLWAREADVVAQINHDHENRLFLPGIALDPALAATGDLAALGGCSLLVAAVPAQHMRRVLAALPAVAMPLVLCAKGIEAETFLLMSEVAAAVQPAAPLAVLSGPTFAKEVAAGLPTAATLACADLALGETLAGLLARPTFRIYLSDDVVGAEIGGAIKNVLAVACGVVEGLGLGENARAALISRGFAEMALFGASRGARLDTLIGLAGLGDLILTCSSRSSRNFSLGVELGRGGHPARLMADRRTVAEGAFTAPVLRAAAQQAGVALPIVEAVCDLLDGTVKPAELVGRLLARPMKSETAMRISLDALVDRS